MTLASDKDLKVKMEFIQAYFNDLENKIAFLDKLYHDDRRDEARVLCSCYIDWLASALYCPEERNNFNFVRILMEYGGEEIFCHIHPKMLDIAFQKKANGNKWKTLYTKITADLKKSCTRLYSEQEIIDLLSPLLSKPELEDVNRNLWRGTFAAIVYDQIRNPSVHAFGPPDGITFDQTTYRGQQCPALDFNLLHNAIKCVATAVQDISMKTSKWFGHDYE